MALRLSHADTSCCPVEVPDIAFPTCSLLHAHHQQATMLYTPCVWALAVREREDDNGGLPGMVTPAVLSHSWHSMNSEASAMVTVDAHR